MSRRRRVCRRCPQYAFRAAFRASGHVSRTPPRLSRGVLEVSPFCRRISHTFQSKSMVPSPSSLIILFLTSSRIERNQRQRYIVPDSFVALTGRAANRPFDLRCKYGDLCRPLKVFQRIRAETTRVIMEIPYQCAQNLHIFCASRRARCGFGSPMFSLFARAL